MARHSGKCTKRYFIYIYIFKKNLHNIYIYIFKITYIIYIYIFIIIFNTPKSLVFKAILYYPKHIYTVALRTLMNIFNVRHDTVCNVLLCFNPHL